MSGHDDPLDQRWIGPGNGDGGMVQPDHPAALHYSVDGRAVWDIPAGEVWCLCRSVTVFGVNPEVPSNATQNMALHTTISRAEGEGSFETHLEWFTPTTIADEVQDADVGTNYRKPIHETPHIPIFGPAHVDTWVANASKDDASGNPGYPVFVYASRIFTKVK